MLSLLESRTHHRHLCILSRKVLESNAYDEEPPRRRFPANSMHTLSTNNDNVTLTSQQRSQKQRWQREKKSQMPPESNDVDDRLFDCQVLVLPSYSPDTSNDNDGPTNREWGQRRRREKEQAMRRVSLLSIRLHTATGCQVSICLSVLRSFPEVTGVTGMS